MILTMTTMYLLNVRHFDKNSADWREGIIFPRYVQCGPSLTQFFIQLVYKAPLYFTLKIRIWVILSLFWAKNKILFFLKNIKQLFSADIKSQLDQEQWHNIS